MSHILIGANGQLYNISNDAILASKELVLSQGETRFASRSDLLVNDLSASANLFDDPYTPPDDAPLGK